MGVLRICENRIVDAAKLIITDCKQAIPEVSDDQTLYHVVYEAQYDTKRPITLYEWAKARRPLLVDKKAFPDFNAIMLARAEIHSFDKRELYPGIEIVQLPKEELTLEGRTSRAFYLNIALDNKAKEAIELVEKLQANFNIGINLKLDRLREIFANPRKARNAARRLNDQIKAAIARGKRRGGAAKRRGP